MIGRKGAVTAQHYLAAEAGADILKAGGNAIDAACAAVLVESVVNPQMFTLGGECPMLIWPASRGKVVAINGNTAAPALARPETFKERGLTEVPAEGVLAAGVPAAFGAIVTSLLLFGTRDFKTVADAALDLSRNGFPIHRGLLEQERFGLRDLSEKFRSEWLASARLYLPEGNCPSEGSLLRNPAFAALLEELISLERAKATRETSLKSVLDGFYHGNVASVIDAFSRQHDGLLRRSDLEEFETKVESPVSVSFGDAELYKCGPWNQGPALLQSLRILENFDLVAMDHNSATYIHHVVEAIKLAFADREQFYADPEFVGVPIMQLISKEYGAIRSKLIDPLVANSELRPGNPSTGESLLPIEARLGGKAWGPGTVHVDAIDRFGNFVAATPSGAWIMSSEVVPELGFPLGNRLMTFYLDPPHHPNIVAPHKRPRTTISPSLASRSGNPWMVFGSMGGDQQDQWQLQFFLNVVLFGMPLNEAVEAAKFSSEHFPGFFAPHTFFRNRLRVEPRISPTTIEDLQRRRHDVDVGPDWSEGYLVAASWDRNAGTFEAACDPRGAKAEIFAAAARCW